MTAQRTDAHGVVRYTDATNSAFQKAIEAVAKALPDHAEALRALLAVGSFHDAEAVAAALGDEADD